jgi:hypothetical protein
MSANQKGFDRRCGTPNITNMLEAVGGERVYKHYANGQAEEAISA